MGIVEVRLYERLTVLCSDARAAKAVAGLGGFQEAGLVVGVIARPTGLCWVAAAMPHREEVPNGIIDVALDIGPHRVAITGVQQVDARCVVMRVRNRRASDLPEMLASCRFDQTVNRVISVIRTRL